VEWSLHEPIPGTYNFEGMADLEYFIKLIQDEGMYLLLRPGPYICAERDFVSVVVVSIRYSYYKKIYYNTGINFQGGFPYWLLNVTPKGSLRTNDSSTV